MMFQRSFHRLREDDSPRKQQKVKEVKPKRQPSKETRERRRSKDNGIVAAFRESKHPKDMVESNQMDMGDSKAQKMISDAAKFAKTAFSPQRWRCFDYGVVPYNVCTAFFYGIGPWF